MLTAGELANLADVVKQVTHNQSGEETLNNEGHPSDDVALEKLREALRQDAPECKDVPDAILRKCLAFQDGDIEKAASTAAGFFNFRSQARWAMRIPASEVSRALKTGLHWLLPGKKDSEDPNEFAAACLVFNMAKLDPDACPIEEYQKLSLFLIERATDSLDVQTRGVALIIDFRSVQFTKLWSVLRLEDIKRGLGCWVGAFPCRLRRIWILDAPLPVRVLTSLVKKFLTPKVRNRIDFVTPKDLQRIREDFVDCIVVPDSLGGTDPFDWDAQVEGYLRCDPRLPLRSPTLLSL